VKEYNASGSNFTTYGCIYSGAIGHGDRNIEGCEYAVM
jgi:hypothetical protein